VVPCVVLAFSGGSRHSRDSLRVTQEKLESVYGADVRLVTSTDVLSDMYYLIRRLAQLALHHVVTEEAVLDMTHDSPSSLHHTYAGDDADTAFGWSQLYWLSRK
jgi:hypothetical protein